MLNFVKHGGGLSFNIKCSSVLDSQDVKAPWGATSLEGCPKV